jgi:dihydrodipicolinate synthase/N-acetylneuraminate lyase
MAIYTLSDPGLGAAKLAIKKLGVPLSPTVRGPALPAPPDSDEAIEATLEAAGLLPVQGEA